MKRPGERMVLPIVLGRRASREIETINNHTSAQDETAAKNVISAIVATIDLVQTFPRSGRVVGDGDLRCIPVQKYDYVVFYRIKPTCVFILRVRHTSRRPLRIKPRAK
jgi:toxin ParE1/3/4